MAFSQAYDPNQGARSLALELANAGNRQQMQSQALNDSIKAQLAPLQLQQAQQQLDQARAEAPLKAALQKLALQQKGVFLSPQRAGMPASLPALPLNPEQQNDFLWRDDAAPMEVEKTFNGELIQDLSPKPQVIGPGVVYDPLTAQTNLNDALQQKINQERLQSDIIKERQIAVAKATAKPASKQEYVVNETNPKDVILVDVPVGGGAPPGYRFVKDRLDGQEGGLKPSEIISAQREIRNTYQEMPSKKSLFGNGQIPGSYELKRRLDSLLKPGLDAQGNPQFKKLNPQAKSVFINAMNNLKDPTSATLTTEAAQIASKMGILDRIGTYVDSVKTGDDVSEEVAADIYQVLTQVYEQGKEEFLENIAPQVENLQMIGKKLEDIGVPVSFAKEVRDRLKPAPSAPNAPVIAGPTVDKSQDQEALIWANENLSSEDPNKAAMAAQILKANGL